MTREEFKDKLLIVANGKETDKKLEVIEEIVTSYKELEIKNEELQTKYIETFIEGAKIDEPEEKIDEEEVEDKEDVDFEDLFKKEEI